VAEEVTPFAFSGESKMVTVEEFKSDYDWREAFRCAWRDTAAAGSHSEPIELVESVAACDPGENDGKNWVALVRLKPEANLGPFAVVYGGCDYTGWG
jgi:hypothetical protein